MDPGDNPETEPSIDNLKEITCIVQWGKPKTESVFFRPPHMPKSDKQGDKITRQEVKLHTMADPDLQSLRAWILGNENHSPEKVQLFEWFLTRQDRLATVNGLVYLCDKPTKAEAIQQTEQARLILTFYCFLQCCNLGLQI